MPIPCLSPSMHCAGHWVSALLGFGRLQGHGGPPHPQASPDWRTGRKQGGTHEDGTAVPEAWDPSGDVGKGGAVRVRVALHVSSTLGVPPGCRMLGTPVQQLRVFASYLSCMCRCSTPAQMLPCLSPCHQSHHVLLPPAFTTTQLPGRLRGPPTRHGWPQAILRDSIAPSIYSGMISPSIVWGKCCPRHPCGSNILPQVHPVDNTPPGIPWG